MPADAACIRARHSRASVISRSAAAAACFAAAAPEKGLDADAEREQSAIRSEKRCTVRMHAAATSRGDSPTRPPPLVPSRLVV